MIRISKRDECAAILHQACEDITNLKNVTVTSLDKEFAAVVGSSDTTIRNWRTGAKYSFRHAEFYTLMWLIVVEGKKDRAWIEKLLRTVKNGEDSFPISKEWIIDQILHAKKHNPNFKEDEETIRQTIRQLFTERDNVETIDDSRTEIDAANESEPAVQAETMTREVKESKLKSHHVLSVMVLVLLLSASIYRASTHRSRQLNAENTASTAIPLPALPDTPISSNDEWEPYEYIIQHDSSGTSTAMVLVPAGSFFMGATPTEINALFEWCEEIKQANYRGFTCQRRALFEPLGPTSEQTIDTFWLDKYEVTRADYNRCVDAGYCREAHELEGLHANSPASTRPNQPINNVDLFQAYSYCQWRGARLPTEVEWEYAARGPDRVRFPWETEVLVTPNTNTAIVNHCDVNCGEAPWSADAYTRTGKWEHITQYNDGYAGTAPVDSYPEGASWIGAFNMAGNVQEWTASLYSPLPYNSNLSESDEPPRTADQYTIKGGSYGASIYVSTTFWRSGFAANDYSPSIGFRCAMSID